MRSSIVTRLTLATLAAALAACAPDATAPTTPRFASSAGEGPDASDAAHRDLNAERAGLLAADAAWSSAASGKTALEALTNAFDDDVYYLLGGFPLAHGKAAAHATLAALPIVANGTVRWRAVKGDVSSDGTLGYTFGYVDRTFADGSDHPGEYIATWRRQANGGWKMAGLVINGRIPGPVDEAAPEGFGTPSYKHYRWFPNTTIAGERAAMMATDVAFSDAAYPDVGAAFAQFAAPDVAKIDIGPIVYGREAVAALFGPADPDHKLEWAPEYGIVASSGDLGFTVGFARSIVVATGQTGWIKYMTIWKKQRTGEWRYVQDGGNGMPAP
jgi:ketosteroid isomerase-like protein